MTKFVVSTKYKKSVEEHEFWEKDQDTIIIVKGYRWGSWYVTSSDKNEPDFVRVHNPLGPESLLSIDMNNCCDNNIVDVDLISLDDVWCNDIIYPDNFTETEREYMDELLDKDGSEGWEQEGWIQTETECWIHGDLSIEKV